MTLTTLFLMAAVFGGTRAPRPEAPVVEQQPLARPDFVLLHTNDTRGYLESCG